MKFIIKPYSGRLDFVLRHLPEHPGKFLDVGNLGDGGPYCNQIRAEVEKRGGEYHGLDSNVNLTKQKNLPNQHLGDMHNAPFDDGYFDVLYLGEIIEHTWDPRGMIRECLRILKPRGLLIIDTPNPYRFTMVARFYANARDNMGDNPTLTWQEAKGSYDQMRQEGVVLLQPQHKIFFTPAMMRQLLITQGFKPEAWGSTVKGSFLQRMLLRVIPQAGHHLCCAARKTTIDEAFGDIAHA